MQELGTQASAISELKKSTDATKATSQNLTALQEQVCDSTLYRLKLLVRVEFDVYGAYPVTGTRLPSTLNPASKPLASVIGHLRAHPLPPTHTHIGQQEGRQGQALPEGPPLRPSITR